MEASYAFDGRYEKCNWALSDRHKKHSARQKRMALIRKNIVKKRKQSNV